MNSDEREHVPSQSLTLREAARATSRSVTTLRRYIRSGRLRAEKRPGRFGPEYTVTATELASAGFQLVPARRSPRGEALTQDPPPSGGESVPMTLFQELQMKHEQLLVQYGMVRAGGLRVFELQDQLREKEQELDSARGELTAVRRRMAEETARLRQRLRRTEFDHEGRGMEVAALREKVRALEQITRGRREEPSSLELQFRSVREQSRRVERLRRDLPGRELDPE